MLKKLIVFPFGGNAREAISCVLDINNIKKEWEVIGFIDDNAKYLGRTCCGYKVIGAKGEIAKHPGVKVLAVPGNPEDYTKTEAIIAGLGLRESWFATIIHPSAVIAQDAKVGFNTLILANVVVGTGSVIGNHCVILPNTVLGHDSIIGDYTCVGANVTVSGGVVIGRNCYIGSGSSLRDNIKVGERALIGIGSNVLKDIPEGVVAAGNPARIIREVTR